MYTPFVEEKGKKKRSSLVRVTGNPSEMLAHPTSNDNFGMNCWCGRRRGNKKRERSQNDGGSMYMQCISLMWRRRGEKMPKWLWAFVRDMHYAWSSSALRCNCELCWAESEYIWPPLALEERKSLLMCENRNQAISLKLFEPDSYLIIAIYKGAGAFHSAGQSKGG